MGLTRNQAVAAAASFLIDQNFSRYGYTPAVDIGHVREIVTGFIVPWNTETFLRTGNISDGLAGNIPLLVDGVTGMCRFMTKEEINQYFFK